MAFSANALALAAPAGIYCWRTYPQCQNFVLTNAQQAWALGITTLALAAEATRELTNSDWQSIGAASLERIQWTFSKRDSRNLPLTPVVTSRVDSQTAPANDPSKCGPPTPKEWEEAKAELHDARFSRTLVKRAQARVEKSASVLRRLDEALAEAGIENEPFEDLIGSHVPMPEIKAADEDVARAKAKLVALQNRPGCKET